MVSGRELADLAQFIRPRKNALRQVRVQSHLLPLPFTQWAGLRTDCGTYAAAPDVMQPACPPQPRHIGVRKRKLLRGGGGQLGHAPRMPKVPRRFEVDEVGDRLAG